MTAFYTTPSNLSVSARRRSRARVWWMPAAPTTSASTRALRCLVVGLQPTVDAFERPF